MAKHNIARHRVSHKSIVFPADMSVLEILEATGNYTYNISYISPHYRPEPPISYITTSLRHQPEAPGSARPAGQAARPGAEGPSRAPFSQLRVGLREDVLQGRWEAGVPLNH